MPGPDNIQQLILAEENRKKHETEQNNRDLKVAAQNRAAIALGEQQKLQDLSAQQLKRTTAAKKDDGSVPQVPQKIVQQQAKEAEKKQTLLDLQAGRSESIEAAGKDLTSICESVDANVQNILVQKNIISKKPEVAAQQKAALAGKAVPLTEAQKVQKTDVMKRAEKYRTPVTKIDPPLTELKRDVVLQPVVHGLQQQQTERVATAVTLSDAPEKEQEAALQSTMHEVNQLPRLVDSFLSNFLKMRMVAPAASQRRLSEEEADLFDNESVQLFVEALMATLNTRGTNYPQASRFEGYSDGRSLGFDYAAGVHSNTPSSIGSAPLRAPTPSFLRIDK